MAHAQFETVTQLPALARRRPDAHKGDFGRVLVIAGSRGMSGAAVLTTTAALRGGAGLVRVAVPQDILPIVAASNPCYMTAPLPQDANGRLAASADELLELAQDSDAVAAGPGLGRSPALVTTLAGFVRRLVAPLVLDADGLNAFADDTKALGRHGGPLVITPHPGEFARLLKTDTKAVQDKRTELAAGFAAEHKLVVVLKGHGTVVTDGRRVFVNPTSNPGMATGGTGDVLTGVIAALLGQGLEPFAAAQLGAYVHGLAGDLACRDLGEVGMIASDLLTYLPRAFQSL
jgi:ADP-dependent NAD(P)H-hydrate dehydratase